MHCSTKIICCPLLVGMKWKGTEVVTWTVLSGQKLDFSVTLSICTIVPEMRVTLHGACYPLLQTDHRFVAQVLFGTFTAVIVMGSSQSHSHGRKSWFERHKRAQDPGEQPEEQGQAVHEPVREVKTWSSITQTHQHLRHEVPEANWLVIGDVIWLEEKRNVQD